MRRSPVMLRRARMCVWTRASAEKVVGELVGQRWLTGERVVVSRRDVHGLSSEEVCEALGITAANQRVLLHRGRAGLRASLEDYYRDTGAGVMT
jgi:RNA polymerase sigma-70 factor (ECF subfamily)